MKNSSRLVAGDGEELDALEQRMRGVARLREHALVELEPAQLAVDVQRRVLQVRRIDLLSSSTGVPGAARLCRGGRRSAGWTRRRQLLTLGGVSMGCRTRHLSA